MRTYTIKGYKTEQDFEEGKFNIYDEGLTKITEALSVGKEALKGSRLIKGYSVVKVESSDYDLIEILR